MSTPGTCDIFCTVIDNFGDIGVCWRLARDLASRGWRVRLWTDDDSALAWMAPGPRHGEPAIQVLAWEQPLAAGVLASANLGSAPCDLLIEAFGCEPAPEFLAACVLRAERSGAEQPVWINLEYLSAEGYVERSHALPSLVRSGPAAGWTRHFFYPGFTPRTGGLLREPRLLVEQSQFDAAAWLDTHGVAPAGEALVSMFCYEPPELPALLASMAAQGWAGRPVRLMVAEGRARRAVQSALQASPGLTQGRLALTFLPLLSQPDFDRLLWACDFNFVRGEDSLVRALWAGRPFAWQIYPQDDGAQWPKLQAFNEVMEFPKSLDAFQSAWNGGPAAAAARPPENLEWAGWQDAAGKVRARLLLQDDLVSQLTGFVRKNR